MVFVIVAFVVSAFALLDGLSMLADGGALRHRDYGWFNARTRRLREGVLSLTGRVVKGDGAPFVVATIRSEVSTALVPGVKVRKAFEEVERTRTHRPFDVLVHGARETVHVDPETARLFFREYTRTSEERTEDRIVRREIAEVRAGDSVRVKGFVERTYEAEASDPYRSVGGGWRIGARSGKNRMEIHRAHRLERRDRRVFAVIELALACVLAFIAMRGLDFEVTHGTTSALVTRVTPPAKDRDRVWIEATYDLDGVPRTCSFVADSTKGVDRAGQRIAIDYSRARSSDCRASEPWGLARWERVAIVLSAVVVAVGAFVNGRHRDNPVWREA